MTLAAILTPRPGVSRRILTVALGLLGVMSVAIPAPAAAEGGINVYVNFARVLKLDREVSKVIVGNPAIADVTISDDETIVVTGRSFGATNLVILDAVGDAIVDERVIVSRDAGDTLRVFRNTEPTVLSCSPVCESEPQTTGSID